MSPQKAKDIVKMNKLNTGYIPIINRNSPLAKGNNQKIKFYQRKTNNEINDHFGLKSSKIQSEETKPNDEKNNNKNKNIENNTSTQLNMDLKIYTPKKIKLSNNMMTYGTIVQDRNNYRLFLTGVGSINNQTSVNNHNRIQIHKKKFINDFYKSEKKNNNVFSRYLDYVQSSHRYKNNSNIMKNHDSKNKKLQYICLPKQKLVRSKSPLCRKIDLYKLVDAVPLQNYTSDYDNSFHAKCDVKHDYNTTIKNSFLSTQLKKNNFRFTHYGFGYRMGNSLVEPKEKKIYKTNFNYRELYLPIEKKYKYCKSPNKSNINKLMIKNCLNNSNEINTLKLNKNILSNICSEEKKAKTKKYIVSRRVGLTKNEKENNNYKVEYLGKKDKTYQIIEIKHVSRKISPKKV